MKIKQLVGIVAICCTGIAYAESNFQTGPGTLSATAHVDFRITIPKVLFLRVGSGNLNTNTAVVNIIDFTVPAADIGSGTAIAGDSSSGDLNNGTVTAVVRSNNGNVTLSASTAGAIGNGSGDNIDWSEITTAAVQLNTGTILAAPTLANGSSSNITLTAVNKVVNQDAKWTYKYANSNFVPSGTYGGANANNGRVTYTAALP